MGSRIATRKAVFAAGAALCILALTSAGPASAEELALRIEHSHGSVEIGRGEPPVWSPAREGEALAPGDRVRTGHGSRAEVKLGTTTARLYENSLLQVPADAMGPGGVERVRMEKGGSLFDVLRRGLGFEVQTPEVVVSVKGTRFEVNLAGSLAAVAVFRGLVGVHVPGDAGAAEVMVREGFAAVGGAEAAFALRALEAGDPWEAWGASGGARPATEELWEAGPPAKADLEAALASGRSEALESLAELASEREPVMAPEALEAAIDSRLAEPETPEIDPVLDAEGSVGSRVREGETTEVAALIASSPTALQAALDGNSSTLGGSVDGSLGLLASLGFDIRLEKDELVFSPDGHHEEKINAGELDRVLNEGKVGELGSHTLDALAAKGVDPIDFARELDALLSALTGG